MPIYEREGGIWHIDIFHNGRRVRRTAGTKNKQEAQELHDKIKHELWRVGQIGDKPKKTWDEACIRWIKEKEHKKSLDDDKAKILRLNNFRGKYLTELSRDYIINTINSLDVANATKNRYTSLINAILKKCSGEWEWIDKAPTLPRYKEPKKRIRWITESEADRLIKALPFPVSEMALFSLMTGLRQSNVLTLEWNQVDIVRQVAWIYADQTKSGKPIGVPLNNTAISILVRHIARDRQLIFVRKDGEKYNGISSKIWARALKLANLSNFKWHDLRHTWASWHVQNGTPLLELKEMGAWESIEMVQKYAHLAPEHLHKNANKLDNMNITSQKVMSQNCHTRKNTLVSELGGCN